MSGIYRGPNGQLLHGDGKPVMSLDPKFLEANAAKLAKMAVGPHTVKGVLRKMVEMMDKGDEPRAGSAWHLEAKLAIANEPDIEPKPIRPEDELIGITEMEPLHADRTIPDTNAAKMPITGQEWYEREIKVIERKLRDEDLLDTKEQYAEAARHILALRKNVPDTDWHAEAQMYAECIGRVKDWCNRQHRPGLAVEFDCTCESCETKRRVLRIIADNLK